MNAILADLTNPFPGLRCFLAEEDYLFFGRHEQIEDLLGRLRTHRLVAVVGTSGSGKSSLVRAGLLPAILGGGMTQAGSDWEIAVMRPGGSPLAHLAQALCEAGLYDADAEDVLFQIQATLERSRNGLIEAVRQSRAAGGAKLLLVVDQFEELFRFNRANAASQEESVQFVNLLLQAAAQAERGIYVVLTMRSDFLGECSQFLELAEAVNDGEFLIPRMTRDQIQEAIEGPIRVRGADIAPRLLFRLLNDVADNQDQLPVLQHALMRTWDLWRTAGATGPLDLEHYEATGGMQEALSRHADELFLALPSDAHRTAAARIFKTLTERAADGRGIRRPTRLDRLTAIAGQGDETVRAVVEAYRVPGVTFLMPPATSALGVASMIDISHESLMRVWTRLRGWVEEEAQSARIYRRLLETAGLHAERRAGLFHDPDLQIAVSWRETSEPNAEWADLYGGGFDAALRFLETSRETAEREEKEREAARQRELERAQKFAEAQVKVARLFKRFAGSLAVGLCLAVALTIWAFRLRREAQRQEAAAQQQRQLAQTKEKEATQSEARAQKTAYAAQMLVAQSAWDSGNIKNLQALLADTASYPDRGFEWYYWQRMCQLDLLTFREHTKDVMAVAYSPDGRWVASGSADTTIKIWEAETGRVRLTLKGHLGAVRCLAFSPDGRHLASGASDNTVKVWDAETGRLVTDFRKHDKEVESLAFSADGRRVGSRDVGSARVWDAETGRELIELATAFGGIRTAFSPDFRRIAIGLKSGNVQVYDLETGRELFVTRRVRSISSTWDWANSVAYSPDGRRIVCGGMAGDLCVWDAETGAPVLALEEAHRNGMSGVVVAFSPDGRRIASGAFDNIIKIRDTESGRELLTLKGHHSAIVSLAFSPDGRRLVSGSDDMTAKVWDLDPNREVLTLLGHSNDVHAIGFSADGKRFLSTDREGTGIVWDTETSRVLRTLTGLGGERGVFFADGRRLAVPQGWSKQPRLDVMDVETGAILSSLKGLAERVLRVAVSRDGRWIATGSGNGFNLPDYHGEEAVRVWDSATGQEKVCFKPHKDMTSALAFSPDGRRIASGNRFLAIWETETGRELHYLDPGMGDAEVSDLAFSPDGRRVAAACRDNTTQVFDAESGRKLLTLQGHSFDVEAVAFSPDGRRIATAGRDNTVKLWEAETGRELLSLKSHRNGIMTLAFSPDGQRIVNGTGDGALEVWRIAPASEVSRRLEEERAAQESLAQRAAALQEELAPIRRAAAAAAKAAEEARAREFAALAGAPEPPPKHEPAARGWSLKPGDPGVIRQWLVLAPVPFKGKPDLNVLKQQIPNEARLHPRAGERPTEAPGGLAWTSVRLGEDSYHLDFVELVNKAHPQADTVNQVAYAVAYILSEIPQTGLTLLVGSDDTARIYLNDKEIYRQLDPSAPWAGDRDKVTGVQLKAGPNVLVFKVANGMGEWGGSVRFLTADGQPVKGIRVTLDPDGKE